MLDSLKKKHKDVEGWTNCADFVENYGDKVDSQEVEVERFIFAGLFTLSIMGLLFIASTIFSTKKLQAHPQPLIAWICVAEALMSYNALTQLLNPNYVACYFGLEKVWSYTVFNFNPTQEELNSYSNTLCTSNALLYSFFQLTSLLLNLCLCFDLIMTIYSPFSPAYRRTKVYYLVSVVGPLIVILFIWSIQSTQ